MSRNFESQFEKWKWKKNLTEKDWLYIASELNRRREKDNRICRVFIGDFRLPDKKVRKETQRYTRPTLGARWSQLAVHPANTYIPPNPRGFEIRSPSPSMCDGRPQLAAPLMAIEPHQIVYLKSPYQLPFIIFQDFFWTQIVAKNSNQLLQGRFWDSSPSLSSSPDSHLLRDIAEPSILESDDPLLMDDNFNSSEYLIPAAMGPFHHTNPYRMLACAFFTDQNLDDLDALEEFERLQYQLPALLANMPEKQNGDLKSSMELLQGPPTIDSGRCFLEVAIYLYSNNMLNGADAPLHWIKEHVPWPTMKEVLLLKLPTLLEFAKYLFRYAVKSGHSDLVDHLIEIDPGLQEVMRSDMELFLDAIKSNNAKVVLSFLEAGASLSDGYFFPGSLQLARSIDIAQILVGAGADVNAHLRSSEFAYDFEAPPLLSAIWNQDLKMALYFISAGANLNKKISWKEYYVLRGGGPVVIWKSMTLLRAAVYTGNTEMVRLLLHAKADVAAVCEFGVRYHYTRPRTYNQTMKATALQAAAAVGNFEIVKLLLEARSDVNEPAHGKTGKTALQAATEVGNVDIVRFLLEHGAQANALGTR
ncbi:hypothetical protein BP5796_12849 [Coleophoma crateriformis]|uniref:Uncharacterized protein n=1 Tax=Coleophoma crateriformis TaxID=565419 RepID=A0A3D8Q6I8_9HELO|nr:hypothetical protein BP5796_12849 [Coleophoma crateriformis]